MTNRLQIKVGDLVCINADAVRSEMHVNSRAHNKTLVSVGMDSFPQDKVNLYGCNNSLRENEIALVLAVKFMGLPELSQEVLRNHGGNVKITLLVSTRNIELSRIFSQDQAAKWFNIVS